MPGLRHRRSKLLLIGLLIGLFSLLWQRARQQDTDWAKAGREKPREVLILSAHPDDEVMFFSPIILSLLDAGIAVWGLCVSRGDADGLGGLRRLELERAYETLGVMRERVVSLDVPQLQDGMSNEWQAEEIISNVKSHIDILQRRYDVAIDTIITFDARGVSGHPNHVALHRAAQHWLRSHDYPTRRIPRILVLQTLPLSVKFFSIFGSLWQHQTVRCPSSQSQAVERPSSTPVRALLPFYSRTSRRTYLTAVKAMQEHASQLVWFRYLYVLFSAHMWGSVLCPALPDHA